MKKTFITVPAFYCFSLYVNAQKTIHFNLAELLNKNQLITDTSNHAHVLGDSTYYFNCVFGFDNGAAYLRTNNKSSGC